MINKKIQLMDYENTQSILYKYLKNYTLYKTHDAHMYLMWQSNSFIPMDNIIYNCYLIIRIF